MASWFEWTSFGLALFSALGVAYLVYQSLLDLIPSWSYGLRVEPARWNTYIDEGGEVRIVNIFFTIMNRTSRDATMQCGAFVPDPPRVPVIRLTPPGSLSLYDTATALEADPLGFPVGAGNGRHLVLSLNVGTKEPFPETVKFWVNDDRIGRRRWASSSVLRVPTAPEFPARIPGPVIIRTDDGPHSEPQSSNSERRR